jgi:hypothetical protein
MATPNTLASEVERNYFVYYARCPKVPYHFILADPASPRWEKTPPTSPIDIGCLGCGPNHVVHITEPWKRGFVSSQERDQLLALREPHGPGFESREQQPYKNLFVEVELYRMADGGYYAWPYVVRIRPNSDTKRHFVLSQERFATRQEALDTALAEGRRRIDGGFDPDRWD